MTIVIKKIDRSCDLVGMVSSQAELQDDPGGGPPLIPIGESHQVSPIVVDWHQA